VLVEILIVVLSVRHAKPEYTDKEIAAIQERYARFIIKSDAEAVPPAPMVETGGAGIRETASEGGAEKTGAESEQAGSGAGDEAAGRARISASRRSMAEARRRERETLSREVGSKGLLGLLTGEGGAAEGDAVSGLFSGSGEGSAGGDLDEILGSVDGLKTRGESGLAGGSGTGTGLRGYRTGRAAGIDDLLSGPGDVESESLERGGDLRVESPSEFSGRGSKATNRSPEAIQEVLLGHVPAIRYCYERELKRDPGLKGKVIVRIAVSPEGAVVNAEILSSTLANERVERCMLSRIRLWKDFKPIDRAEGDVTFRQIYTFGT
ncbi:TonB family protein, partial [bacterium]|nr:TonB family protein [bacterium]